MVEEAIHRMTLTQALIPTFTLLVGLVIGYHLCVRGDERQIRYTRLYERRAEVIACLSELLFWVQGDFQSWTSPIGYQGEPGKKEKMKSDAARFNELSNYYYTNTIWLDKQSRQKLETFLQTLRDLFGEFSWIPESGTQRSHQEMVLSGPSDEPSRREVWREVNKKVLVEVPELRSELEDEFRAILWGSDIPNREAPRSWWQRIFGG